MQSLFKIVLTISGLLFSSACYAQSLEILSESMFHGSYYSVAVTGDYAFFSGHGHLLSVSFENPSAPEVVAIRQFNSGTSTAFLVGNYVYFVGGASGDGADVEIVDISNPLNPRTVTTFNTQFSAYDIFVEGDYAYVADYSGQILIANVADPENPYAESRINTSNEAYALTLSGDYLYVAEYDSGLVVIDVADPAQPIIVGRAMPDTSERHYFVDIAISGSYAYVADNSNGLQIFDLSNPVAPNFVSSLRLNGGGISRVAVDNNTVYGSAGWRSLYIVDVSNPLEPDSLNVFNVENENPRNFAISDSRLFLLGNEYHGNYGYVNMIDISVPSQPALIGAHRGCQVAASYVALSGNYAFVGSNGIYAMDITDPGNPVKVGEFSRPISHLSIMDSIAYAFTDSNRLILFDVSNPQSPTTLGLCNLTGYSNGLAPFRDYVYVTSSSSGFYIIAASDPHSPNVVRHFDDGSDIGQIVCDERYLYSASNVLNIFDIDSPESPIHVGSYTLPYSANNIFVAGNYAFLTPGYPSWVDLVMVIDLSDRANPVLASTLETLDSPDAVYVEGNYAYIVESGVRVEVADISNPYDPVMVTGHNVSGLDAGIVVRDNILYLATYLSFVVMQFEGVDGVNEISKGGYESLDLECFPNPSNSSITVKYSLAIPVNVSLTIYDLHGRHAKTVLNEYQNSGEHRITWSASQMASGIYFAELNAGSKILRGKFVLLK